MATTPPALGYGNRAEVSIDTYNQWQRQQPWYQALIRSFGQDPNNVHLNDAQKQQILRAAQANGVVVDEGNNGQEVDNSGNFQAKSHTLRNTLIVAGIAGAALATAGVAGVFGGAAAGGSAAGGGTLASTATAPTVGALAPGLASGSSYAASLGGAAAAGGGSVAGLSYADLLKYGLPVAGNLVGGLIQAKASTAANDAQQKYLEEALAYQKEQDTYNRARQATLDAQDVSRYAGYQGRIAPFIANGTSSNDRMAALLGLPARAAGSGGGSDGSASAQGVALSPDITARVLQNYKDLGVTPTGPGTGATDSAYFAKRDAETGGLTDANNTYWFGPNGRIARELAQAGIQGTPSTAAPAATAPASAASTGMVSMKAPDGSVKSVPSSQVDYYTSKGATLLQGAA